VERNAKIFVAGHRGLVGSALVRALRAQGFENLLLRTSKETDLRDAGAVEALFAAEKPDYVFDAAAKVGGILANNNFPGDFIRDNLLIQGNVIDASRRHGVKKLLFLASSCIYPRDCPQPIREDYLLTGPLEVTNDAYAVAKIAGIKMCQSYNRQYGTNYISVMPTNLYGPQDNFDLAGSHVLPALMRKFHEALPDRPVTVWGSGTPKREFLHADDLAAACVHLMQTYDGSEIVNIGTGEDLSIRELAELIQKVVGHQGPLVWDASKPDGTPRKLLNVDRLHALGFRHAIGLEQGLRSTYAWFLENVAVKLPA
jgi:GDP-L-fucose synthase